MIVEYCEKYSFHSTTGFFKRIIRTVFTWCLKQLITNFEEGRKNLKMPSIKSMYEKPEIGPTEMLTPKDFLRTHENFRVFPKSPGDEIVISGISGRYPECDNVEELSYNLYNKVLSAKIAFDLFDLNLF